MRQTNEHNPKPMSLSSGKLVIGNWCLALLNITNLITTNMSSTNTSFASLTTSFTTSTSEFIYSTCQKRFKKQSGLSRHLNIVKKYNIPRNDLDNLSETNNEKFRSILVYLIHCKLPHGFKKGGRQLMSLTCTEHQFFNIFKGHIHHHHKTLDAAKELTVSFRNRGLTWHSSDQVKNLCHTNYIPDSKLVLNEVVLQTIPDAPLHAPAPTLVIRGPIIIRQVPIMSNPNITPEEVAALQQQILELFMIIRSMDERIEWFSAQLESHEYRIVELENTVYFDNSPTSTYEQFDDYQADETYNWDDADRVPHKLLPSRSLIMQISPDTSFSHDGPANVLSSRHVFFPTSEP
ncbi:unnamed protein product [Rhizophagus irregularis]|nr:unnamed protein product [Rhizophagus irregularis]